LSGSGNIRYIKRGGEVIEEWLYVKGKDEIIYGPSSTPASVSGGFIV